MKSLQCQIVLLSAVTHAGIANFCYPCTVVAAAGVPTTAPIGLLRTGLARLEGNDLKVQPTVTNATSVSIAIVDTGVDSKHPDILLAGGKDFTPDNDYGLDGNGHGTHVRIDFWGEDIISRIGGHWQLSLPTYA
jgi:hypothetical protein